MTSESDKSEQTKKLCTFKVLESHILLEKNGCHQGDMTSVSHGGKRHCFEYFHTNTLQW